MDAPPEWSTYHPLNHPFSICTIAAYTCSVSPPQTLHPFPLYLFIPSRAFLLLYFSSPLLPTHYHLLITTIHQASLKHLATIMPSILSPV